jgi:hypothetical protein
MVRLHIWIGGVIFLNMVEMAMFTLEYQNINLLGQTTQVSSSASLLQIRVRLFCRVSIQSPQNLMRKHYLYH